MEYLESDNADSPIKHLFTGHEHDLETGLIYMKARYYDPEICRFISVDPPIISGQYFGDDAPAGGIYNPVNLNSYQYASNNPVRYTDPTGKWTVGTHTFMSALGSLTGGIIDGLIFGDMNSTDIWMKVTEICSIFLGNLIMDLAFKDSDNLHSGPELDKGSRNGFIAGMEVAAIIFDIGAEFMRNEAEKTDNEDEKFSKNFGRGVFTTMSGIVKGMRDHAIQDIFSHQGENGYREHNRDDKQGHGYIMSGIILGGDIAYAILRVTFDENVSWTGDNSIFKDPILWTIFGLSAISFLESLGMQKIAKKNVAREDTFGGRGSDDYWRGPAAIGSTIIFEGLHRFGIKALTEWGFGWNK